MCVMTVHPHRSSVWQGRIITRGNSFETGAWQGQNAFVGAALMAPTRGFNTTPEMMKHLPRKFEPLLPDCKRLQLDCIFFPKYFSIRNIFRMRSILKPDVWGTNPVQCYLEVPFRNSRIWWNGQWEKTPSGNTLSVPLTLFYLIKRVLWVQREWTVVHPSKDVNGPIFIVEERLPILIYAHCSVWLRPGGEVKNRG